MEDSAAEAILISGETVTAMATRLLFINTHYRKPLNFTEERLAEMEKIWRRWIQRAEPAGEPPPLEFIEAMCDDMNTPKAIALIHGYYKRRQSGQVFACMDLLGLIPLKEKPTGS